MLPSALAAGQSSSGTVAPQKSPFCVAVRAAESTPTTAPVVRSPVQLTKALDAAYASLSAQEKKILFIAPTALQASYRTEFADMVTLHNAEHLAGGNVLALAGQVASKYGTVLGKVEPSLVVASRAVDNYDAKVCGVGSVVPAAALPAALRGADRESPRLVPVYSRYDTLPTWAGVVAEGEAPYASVQADWSVPQAYCGSLFHNFVWDSTEASWVGLDGFPPSDTVEQIGTDSNCVGNTHAYWTWGEMFPREPWLISWANHHDQVQAKVEYNYAENNYSLSIVDSAGNTNYETSDTAAQSQYQNSSAEAIVEQPNFDGWQLTNFGQQTFDDFYVTAPSVGTDSEPIGALSSVRVDMVSGSTTKARTSYEQGNVPSKSFSVDFVSS
jgi:hypothetical protein